MREAANVLDPHALGGKADSNRRSLSQTSRLSDGTRDAARAKRRVSAASAIFRGTERSNPASSSGESGANSISWIMVGADG